MDQARIWRLPGIYRGEDLEFGLEFSNWLDTKGGQSLHRRGITNLENLLGGNYIFLGFSPSLL